MAKATRPPVITILGHVDHGKTSILDRIRHTNIQAKEAGGITQAIGAYQIDFQGRKITFIDTPGHAAFSAMRARGGKVADLAVLVVAADDSVKPQTLESIEHIKAAAIPYVVAINKIDLPGANPAKVKADLAEAGQYLEGYGGNIPVVELSAKTGQGIDILLETLLLLADIEALPDTSQEKAQAIVIESSLHRQKGPIASLLVTAGVFRLKDELYQAVKKIGKIKIMQSASGDLLNEAGPATPVLILGFESLPSVGDIIYTFPAADTTPSRLKTNFAFSKTDETLPNIIIKADVAGSLEAIIGSLPPSINLLQAQVGEVSETDIDLASVNQAIIVAFNLKFSSHIKKLAQVEKVTLVNFTIIYELLDYLNDLSRKLAVSSPPPVEGEAKILKVFNFDGKTIYGCIVLSGKIRVNDKIKDAKITSLQIGKDSVKEVKKDQECGLVLTPQLDFKPGDVVTSTSNL
ncbi:GTP-binding protein [Candidatus Collierbacteria bacterium]|nr:GTP-binding protein [Candidatus Collierbacteria bacterium]